MNSNREFEYASYKKVYQPQYDEMSQGSADYFQHKMCSYVNFDMRTHFPNVPGEKLKVLQELYDSERTYVIYLTAIDELFIQKFGISGVISRKRIRTLFGDISAICQTNQILLESLRIKPVSEAFIKLLPYLKLYTSYASQYPNSLKLYAQLMSKVSFRHYLSKLESDPRCQGNKLAALLIMPVQRIPRYILLIEKLMLLSTDPTEMHGLSKVVSEMRSLSENMQLCMATYENGERLLHIQDAFGLERHVFEPGRRLVKEGLLYKREMAGSAIFQERVFFLFNDILLYGKKRMAIGVVSSSKYEPSAIIALRHAEIEHNELEGTIYIKCGDARLVITADTFETVKEWFASISTAVDRAKTLRSTLRKESFNKKVLYFDKGFWKRRREALRALVTNDMGSTVERVFSKRRPLEQMDDEDFLSGNWTRNRKRMSVRTFDPSVESWSKRAATKELMERKKAEEFEPPIFDNSEPTSSMENPAYRESGVLRSLANNSFREAQKNLYEDMEGVDETDRASRGVSVVRSQLAVEEIRKLSYQQQCAFELQLDVNETMDEEPQEDVENRRRKQRETPWWAVESAPPVIKNQKTGIVDTVRSSCSIM